MTTQTTQTSQEMNNNVDIPELRKKTFRFKFTEETQNSLAYFADVHKLDDRVTFKEEWGNWIKENDTMLKKETQYLQEMGYDGNVENKMFKSARYYFKNKKPKDVEDQEPKQRRKYIKVDKNILKLIDTHIDENVNNENYKPATGFEMFKTIFENELSNEIKRIKETCNINDEDIEQKMKKTYKNRYFNKLKNV